MQNNQLLKWNKKSTVKVVYFNYIFSYWSLYYIIIMNTILGCASENNSVKTAPLLVTTSVSNITLNSVESGGNITSDGGDAVITRGIVLNTATSPTITLTTKTIDGNGTGSFSSSITNLLPSSTYFIRAYATNSIGTGYGNELSFTTGAIVLPTLTTTAITSITTNSGVSGGNITADGGGTITARGIVWSTSQNPTIALTTKTNDWTGLGSFASNMTALVQNTTYYIKAFATNSAGTAYGNQIEFKTNANSTTGNVTDTDGNVYKTIQIGTQVWMAENLNVTKYSDGTPIPQVTDPTAWAALTTGAWCSYNNNPANDAIYGKLYNWYAVVGIYDGASSGNSALRKKIAPDGWHVSIDAEWTTLITYLGGDIIAGGKMKEAGTNHWTTPNTAADNSSGFTGISGSFRYGYTANANTGTFYPIGSDANWWSPTSVSDTLNTPIPWFRSLYFETGNIYRYNYEMTRGLSVRCLRD